MGIGVHWRRAFLRLLLMESKNQKPSLELTVRKRIDGGLLECPSMNNNFKRALVGAVLSLAVAWSLSMRSHYSQRIRRLEIETQSLAKEMSEAIIARGTAEEAGKALARRLEGQTSELLKLRRQVSDSTELQSRVVRLEAELRKVEVLRERNQDVTPDNASLTSNNQPVTISATNWKDLGGISAQDAVQTFLWSLRNRNADRLVEFVDPADRELLVKEGEIIASELAKVTGYTLLDSVQISPEQEMLRLRLDEENGEVKTEEFHFLNIGGRWHFSESAKMAHLKSVENSKP
jgi:hypothetical protein